MERVEKSEPTDSHEPRGYTLGSAESAQEAIASTDALLQSEGLDLSWPTREQAVADSRKSRQSIKK